MTSNAAVANFSADEALRRRLEDFRFDAPGALFPFSSRLAKQEGWSAGFAARAIAEYRRFLYLACVSGREMTPAPAVDAVWHLHLIYTRSYWDELCGAVLRRPLHHNPTNGGRTEDSRFRTAYAATLACYETAFGTAPPADIWHRAAVLSGARATSPILRAIATLAVIATPLPALAQGANIELFKRYGAWIAAGVALVFVIGRQIRRSLHTPKDQRKSGSDGGGGCSSSDSGSQGASSDSGGGSSDSGGSGCGSSCGGGGGD
jgi:hypothetical protein